MAALTLHLRFPPFSLDAQRHLLLRDGEATTLSPHLVDILFHLASRAGEIVEKDALMDEFWPDVHVSENTLTRAIADIRKALGDDSSSPRFIQTVARRGYRFVAPVTAVTMEEHSAASHPRHETGERMAHGFDPFREWVRGRLSLEALDATKLPEAVAAFEHAVQATPHYAPAYAGLANAYAFQFERMRASHAPDRTLLTRAIDHARRACEKDPSFGEAWATLSFVLTAAGDGEEAIAAGRRAAALEPTSWRHHFRLAIASWGEERLRAVDRTLALFPDFPPARFLAVMVFVARRAFGPAMELAAAGAASEARQRLGDRSRLPSIGLQWLHGLLLLHRGNIGSAIIAFAHEIDAALDDRIYGPEFRTNAQIAAGFAHLEANDPGGATAAFRAALETSPRNGRALIGLYRAFTGARSAPREDRLPAEALRGDINGRSALAGSTSLALAAETLLPQIDRTIAELVSGDRPAEAAMVRAAAAVARSDFAGACDTLRQLLDAAPPGQAGWLIPIDPALAPLRARPEFESIAAQLAARAA